MTRPPPLRRAALAAALAGLLGCDAPAPGDADAAAAEDAAVRDAGEREGVDAGARPDAACSGCPADGLLALGAGRHHTCALAADATLSCWGQGAYRALGGDYAFQGTPRVVEAIDDAGRVSGGTRFGCAVREGGSVACWGENDHGQIGDHATVPCGDCTPLPDCADSVCVPTPQPMAELGAGVLEVSLGSDHGCALRDDGRVLCWGDNTSGQAGQPELGVDVRTPTEVAGIDGAVQVTAGLEHSCALIGAPGTVRCWGRNDRAQVGNGETGDAVPAPATVAGLDDAVEVVGGGSHTCARRADGRVVCWGYNYLGALGNGSTRPTRASAIQEVVGVDDAEALAAGQHFSCAARRSGRLACWGDNRHGQLGDGTAEGADCAGRPCRVVPVEVQGIADAALLVAGELHACASDRAGRLFCWGYNLGGQLGTGGVNDGPTPTPVEVTSLP